VNSSAFRQLVREELDRLLGDGDIQVDEVSLGSLGQAAKKMAAAPGRLGAKAVSKSKQAMFSREKAKGISSGEQLSGIEPPERSIMVDLEKIIAAIAEKDNLIKYKSVLQTVVNRLRKAAGV